MLLEIKERSKEVVFDGLHDLVNLDSNVLGCSHEISCLVSHEIEHEHGLPMLHGEMNIKKNLKESLISVNSLCIEMDMQKDLPWPRIYKHKLNPRKWITCIEHAKSLG